MRHGFLCGNNSSSKPKRRSQHLQYPKASKGSKGPLWLFLAETGGYTSIAVACSLVVSVSLLFGMSLVGWYVQHSNKTQTVADAAALAGANVVAGYTTVAQTLDSCVLSMGITGALVGGVGLVLSIVPGLSAQGLETVNAAHKIFDARAKFAKTANKGLAKFEQALPVLIAHNGTSTIKKNASQASQKQVLHAGTTIPFPLQSQSKFALDETLPDTTDLQESATTLGKQSDKAHEAKQEAQKALEEAWFFDCGARPYCLWQRAKTLSDISEQDNPAFDTAQGWNFEVPLRRAQTYYARRLAQEKPAHEGVEELCNSAARKAFYQYAYETLSRGSVQVNADKTVRVDLPKLPMNTEELKTTSLYTQALWPMTMQGNKKILHCSPVCPHVQGQAQGFASLADLDAGRVEECPICRFKTSSVGKVPAASTSIENGFEHWWAKIVDCASRYETYQNQLIEAEKAVKSSADASKDVFARALEALRVDRPKLCPPGAWGCIGVVLRNQSEPQVAGATSFGLAQPTLPGGCAVSGAVLALDKADAQSNVLSHLFDGLSQGQQGLLTGIPQQICQVWGRLLMSYNAVYESIGQASSRFFDGFDQIGGSHIAHMLKDALVKIVEEAGFAPVDLRAKKPVMVNTQKILTKAGYQNTDSVRQKIEGLPEQPTPTDIAKAFGSVLVDSLPESNFTIASLPIPGTDVTIPLTIDIRKLVRLI